MKNDSFVIGIAIFSAFFIILAIVLLLFKSNDEE